MPSAGVGRKLVVNAGAVPVCRLNWIGRSEAAGNTARVGSAAVADQEVDRPGSRMRLIWRRILARSALALWVLNRLAATIL